MNTLVMGIRRRVICHVFAACVAFVLVAPIVFMAADRQSPIIIHETTIFPPSVRAGDTVLVTWTATELRGCEGTIYRRFIDSQGTIFEIAPVPSIYRGLLTSGKKTFSSSIAIPHGLASGPAAYTGTREYRCNPLHWIWPIREKVAPTHFTVIR